jgi:hypothetical protein
MAGDGMDATLATLLSQTLQPKKRIRRRRMPASAQSIPINSGSIKPQAPPQTAREPSERRDFILNEILSVVMKLHFSFTS